MEGNVSIIVSTFGDKERWYPLARRALESAHAQTVPVEVIYVHHPSNLAAARNHGAQTSHGTRLVFLDADDWLDKDFAEKIVEPENVLQPMTGRWYGCFVEEPSYLPPRDDLIEGNHLIVGCPVDKEVFLDVGGFDDWPVYEDWALWLKIRAAGGSFGKTTGVYNVNYNPNGRNQDPRGPETYDAIRRMYS